MMLHIISRATAKDNGLKAYFTGKACKHGHIDLRLTSDGGCYECSRIKQRNMPNKAVKLKEWRDKNKEKVRAYNRKQNTVNGDKRRKSRLEYYYRNKESCSNAKKAWAKANPEKVALARIKRRYIEKQATVCFSNKRKIKEFYENRPKGYHVDHIVPLNNSFVCGLHVEYNLQYLPASENIKKSNKFKGVR